MMKIWHFRWGLTAALLLITAFGLGANGMRLAPAGVWSLLPGLLGIAAAWATLTLFTRLKPPHGKAELLFKRAGKMLHAMLFLAIFTNTCGVLSYLALTLDMPLVDGALARADAWIGFDWLAMYREVARHATLSGLLLICYLTAIPQLIITTLATAFFAPAGRLDEFISTLCFSAVMVLPFATLTPAHGAYYFNGITTSIGAQMVSDFNMLRSGLMPVIDIRHLQGLVSIPSFHACMAILFIFAAREMKWWFYAVSLLNGLVLLSTPYCGGHYLVDVLAGGVLALAAICWSRFFLAPRWQ